MAGTLLNSAGFSNHFHKILSCILSKNVCWLHCHQPLLTFPLMNEGQHIKGFTALKASFSLYFRNSAISMNYCLLNVVDNSLMNKSQLWRKNSSKISGDFSRSPSCPTQVRYKSKSRQESTHEAPDDEDEDDALEEDDFEAPPNFKVIKIHATSTRADAVASHALDVGRSNLEEIFLGHGMYLNGTKLQKKSVKMDESDYVDLVVEKAENQLKVKRVKLLKIYPDKTNKDKIKLKVRIWKTPFFIAKPESGSGES